MFEAARQVGGLAVSHRDAKGFTHDVGDVALPLIEAWSGLPAERLSPEVVGKIPSAAQSLYLAFAARFSVRAIALRIQSGRARERERLTRLSAERAFGAMRT